MMPENIGGDNLVFTTEDEAWEIYKTNAYTEASRWGESMVYAYHAECEDIKLKVSETVNCWYTQDQAQKCIICRARCLMIYRL